MDPLSLVRLPELMKQTSGSTDIKVGLIDGPVALDHPDLSEVNVRTMSAEHSGVCTLNHSSACIHGTFIAGILFAKRNSNTPGICPDCTFLMYPIFGEAAIQSEQVPSTTPDRLADAIIACTDGGTRVINISAGIERPSKKYESKLNEAFDYAIKNGTMVVVAAGNQGFIGSSPLTRHPWVIPVAACDHLGTPLSGSTLGNSIGRRGLRAPGSGVSGLGTTGKPLALTGTSVAAPFVTGTLALLSSLFPGASASELKSALGLSHTRQRNTVVPPLLDAQGAFEALRSNFRRYSYVRKSERR